MPSVDLASSPLRELNSALHALTDNTNATHWTVSNPRGQHNIAVGLDFPVEIEIDGHVG
jgi:hypothetical protein